MVGEYWAGGLGRVYIRWGGGFLACIYAMRMASVDI